MARFVSRFVLTIALSVAGFFFCGFSKSPQAKSFNGYQKVGSSYFRQVRRSADTVTARVDGAIFISIKFLNEKDSVFLDLNEKTQRPSFPFRIDPPKYKGDFLDLMSRLHTGDSAVFFMRLDSLNANYPREFFFNDPKYDRMTWLGMAVRVDSVYSPEKMQVLRAKQEEEKQRQREIQARVEEILQPLREKATAAEPYLKEHDQELLTDYLRKNNITTQPDADGIYFIEMTPGSGEQLTAGRTIGVRYTGYYLDGSVFDSNELLPEQPLMYFRLGVDPMIAGFTNMLLRMHKGEKARFILPPAMGYNDGLTRIFEVEIVEVQ